MKISSYKQIKLFKAFTFVELLIVMVIMTMLLFFAYKLFFSQTEVVTTSIEFMEVNDSFRKIMAFLGDDIKESTRITFPSPILNEQVETLTTITGPILKLLVSEPDPTIPFDAPLGGQIAQRTEIVYELEKIPNPNAKNIPRFRLIRTATVSEKPGQESTQRQELVDNVRDLIIYRTVRKPFKPGNIAGKNDRIAIPRPLYESGTGNSLVHVNIVIERDRKPSDKGQVYNINLNTCFYKRGKELFANP